VIGDVGEEDVEEDADLEEDMEEDVEETNLLEVSDSSEQ